jgi:hypothetical protein
VVDALVNSIIEKKIRRRPNRIYNQYKEKHQGVNALSKHPSANLDGFLKVQDPSKEPKELYQQTLQYHQSMLHHESIQQYGPCQNLQNLVLGSYFGNQTTQGVHHPHHTAYYVPVSCGPPVVCYGYQATQIVYHGQPATLYPPASRKWHVASGIHYDSKTSARTGDESDTCFPVGKLLATTFFAVLHPAYTFSLQKLLRATKNRLLFILRTNRMSLRMSRM